jgi:hypothetical protein
MIRFSCPFCGKQLKSDIGTTGRLARCPKCTNPVEVPGIEPNARQRDRQIGLPGKCLELTPETASYEEPIPAAASDYYLDTDETPRSNRVALLLLSAVIPAFVLIGIVVIAVLASGKTESSITLTTSINPGPVGATTLTATVSAVKPTAATPSGTLTFLEGASPLGTATLTGGRGTLTLSSLSVGNHTITGSYAGDENFKRSISNQTITVSYASDANPRGGGSSSITHGVVVDKPYPGPATAEKDEKLRDQKSIIVEKIPGNERQPRKTPYFGQFMHDLLNQKGFPPVPDQSDLTNPRNWSWRLTTEKEKDAVIGLLIAAVGNKRFHKEMDIVEWRQAIDIRNPNRTMTTHVMVHVREGRRVHDWLATLDGNGKGRSIVDALTQLYYTTE